MRGQCQKKRGFQAHKIQIYSPLLSCAPYLLTYIHIYSHQSTNIFFIDHPPPCHIILFHDEHFLPRRATKSLQEMQMPCFSPQGCICQMPFFSRKAALFEPRTRRTHQRFRPRRGGKIFFFFFSKKNLLISCCCYYYELLLFF